MLVLSNHLLDAIWKYLQCMKIITLTIYVYTYQDIKYISQIVLCYFDFIFYSILAPRSPDRLNNDNNTNLFSAKQCLESNFLTKFLPRNNIPFPSAKNHKIQILHSAIKLMTLFPLPAHPTIISILQRHNSRFT